MEEFDLIEKYFSDLSSPEGLNLEDDGAVLSIKGGKQVVVTDNFVEWIHFLPGDSPFFIAKKLLRRNVSDLLAMGAKPRFYLLNLFLTKEEFSSPNWLDEFVKGLKEDQKSFGINLVGGDTTLVGEGKLSFSLTAIGECPNGKFVSRCGASVGDDIWVTGTIGLSYEGLLIRFANQKKQPLPFDVKESAPAEALMSSLSPTLPFGLEIADFATSAMDVSDSFIQDCSKMANLSKVDFLLAWEDIPKPQNIWNMSDVEFKKAILDGGDDYQLVFTAPKAKREQIVLEAKKHQVKISRVGEVVKGDGKLVVREGGDPIDLSSYKHGWVYRA